MAAQQHMLPQRQRPLHTAPTIPGPAARPSVCYSVLPRCAFHTTNRNLAQAPPRGRQQRGAGVAAAAADPYNNPALYTSEDAFSLSTYWDARYRREGGAPFEWYRDYGSLEPVLSRHLDKSQRLLHVGVGTSRIQFQMHHDGYSDIVNVDYAPVCIEQLSAAHAGLPGLSYEVADCRNMPQYDDESFAGGVLDKGTVDALLCGDSEEADSLAMLKECHRVLARGSSYICITYAPPRSRLRYFQRPGLDWEVSFYEVGQQGHREGPVAVGEECAHEVLDAFPKQVYSHFVYVCNRR